jgi:SAM-dependent methyltransferase
MTMEAELRGDEDPQVWFREHYGDAADQVLSFLTGDGLSLAGLAVADIGCGDGIIDLGLAIKGGPEKLVGYDVRPVDEDALRRSAQVAGVAGVADGLPPNLSFAASEVGHVPAPDDTYDLVVTWSVFEHVTQPVQMLSEIARVLKPSGALFLQLWPFYHSEHGGHLWPHFAGPFPHLLQTDAEIRDRLPGLRATDPTREALDEYDSLNRITLDELQRAMLAAGLVTVKLELVADAVHIPRELSHLPLSLLGIGGVKLLAVAADPSAEAQPPQARNGAEDVSRTSQGS